MNALPFRNEIFEPVEVLKAPRFADRAMMMTAEGEIRVYGARLFQHEDGRKSAFSVVMKSDDGGWNFREEPVPPDHAGPSVPSPWSGDYLTMLSLPASKDTICRESEVAAPLQLQNHEPGTYVLRSVNGPDGPWQKTKITDALTHLQRLPLPLKHRKRWINIGQRYTEGTVRPVLFLSDDDGFTWREKILPYPPMFELHPPHKGLRWVMPGVEPAFAETPSGRILMLLRTSVDVHYQCYSDEGGESWSEMVPSHFFSVATMPGIYTLSNGRMIAVWNNTTPLPELDHTTQQGADQAVIDGRWEDVFTNRDVLHAAVSDDEGISWHGFREIVLNPVRNSGDLRTCGGSWELRDKSVHQNQLLELPGGKVLLHYGQQSSCSRLVIFDPAFLDVTERRGDFMFGLRDWSTQIYYKSISGGLRIAGHCAWNRRSGAQLMPSPHNDWTEALLIGRHPDERLFSDREGAVWNFPAARQGVVTVDLTFMPGSQGIRLSLCDRWLNPCDEYVREQAVFTISVDGRGYSGNVKLAEPGKKVQLTLHFDLDRNQTEVSSEYGSFTLPVTQTMAAPFGAPVELSYLHLQTLAESADERGVFLHGTFMRKDK